MNNSFSTTNKIYENYKVLSPDGIEMFRCGKKKYDWYLKRNLAEIVPSEKDTIKLKFKPNGLGWSGTHYYLQDRENKCCVCGSEKELSRHHVVPYCYRKHMPNSIKDNNFFDILPLCCDCHNKYEKIATDKKLDLAKKYDLPFQKHIGPPRPVAKVLSRTLLTYGNSIPETRKQEMLDLISERLGQKVLLEDLPIIANSEPLYTTVSSHEKYSHGKLIQQKVTSLQEFFEEWRSHFVETMKPKYLPKDWEIDRDLYGRVKNEKI